MPRHTHPTIVAKHDRGTLRHQRERVISNRWRYAKLRFNDSYHRGAHPESVDRIPSVGVIYADQVVSFDDYPFYRPDNFFARNPWTLCSCLLCKWDKNMVPRRAIEGRAVRQDIIDQREEG